MARVWLAVALFTAAAAGACSNTTSGTDLRTLVVQDSTYLDPLSLEPFSGAIYRTFPGDSTRNEIEGTLLEGAWHGELIVYHPSGRLRYMGSFNAGDRCGPWTENQDDRAQGTNFRQLVSDIESLAIYGPCSTDR